MIRVLRGESYWPEPTLNAFSAPPDPRYWRCADRDGLGPNGREEDIGFRIAKRESQDRVKRGGGWINVAGICRSAYRFESVYRSYSLGFRLARRKI